MRYVFFGILPLWLFVLSACGGGIRAGNPTPPPGRAEGVEVSGRLVKGAKETNPVIGQEVRLEGPQTLVEVTDEDGRFYFKDVTDGAYVVKTWVRESEGAGASYAVSITEVVVGGNPIDLGDLALPGALAGRVVLAGASDFTGIDVFIPGSSFIAKTDVNGDFVMLGVQPGNYALRASRYGYDDQQLDGIIVVSGEVTKVPAITLTKGNVAGVAPTLVGVSPAQTEFGQTLTLSGSNFGGLQGDGKVYVAGVAAPVVAWSDTLILATVPAQIQPGYQSVYLVRGGLTSNGVALGIRPALLAVTPVVTGNTSLTVSGANLGAVPGTLQLVGPVTTTLVIVAWSTAAVTAVVPANIPVGPYAVHILNSLADQSGQGTTVTFGVQAFGPTTVTAHTTITVTGTNLGASQGASEFTLGGLAAAVSSWNHEQILATPSPLAEPGVTEATLQIGARAVTYPVTIEPAISSVQSAFGSGGTTATPGATVTVTGANLGAMPGTITVGGVTADISSWSATGFSFTMPSGVPDGPQPVAFAFGGQSVGVEVPVTVDATPPETQVTGGPAAVTNVTVPTVTFSATDVAGVHYIECSLDAGPWEVCTSPWTHAPLAAGGHTLAIRASDLAGNTDPTPATRSWTLDVTPPETAITAGPPAVTDEPTAGFSFAGSDNLGVAQLRCRLDDGPWFACTSPATLDSFTLGDAHTLWVRAVDTAGNFDPTPATWTWYAGSLIAAQVAAGTSHSCAITQNAELRCWGNNSRGQLGDGTKIDRGTPVTVAGFTGNAAQVAVGRFHTCALTTAGGVKCWGYNNFGQVGDGTTCSTTQTTAGCNGSGGKSLPVDVAGLTTGVRSIASSGDHTCAVTTAGGVKCWGLNSSGQLGDGNTLNAAPYGNPWPADVLGLSSGAVTVAVGQNHTCAVTDTGGLRCWGVNDHGELGDGTSVAKNYPVEVTGVTGTIGGLTTGDHKTCVVVGEGTLQCWGSGFGSSPSLLAGYTSAVSAITLTGSQTCVVHTGGDVTCWGGNNYGQLGAGTLGGSVSFAAPVTVTGFGAGAIAVASGANHACAVKVDGSLWCWGDNSAGQLGNGVAPAVTVPTYLSDAWTQVDAGYRHACARKTDGTLWCWGENASGQLGVGDRLSRQAPAAITLAADWLAATAGSSISCALRGLGTLWCWGQSFGATTTPMQIGSLDTWDAVAAATNHACALDSSGQFQCWGSFEYNPSVTFGTWQQIATGARHTCGIQIDGSLWCWGFNHNGQIGDGTSGAAVKAPTRVGTATWRRVAVSDSSHTCAVKDDDTLWCWGRRYGTGYEVGSVTTPEQVGTAAAWQSVAAGDTHACALKLDGTLWCWGNNDSGQLGNGGYTTPNAPVREATQSIWSTVTAGGAFTCGIRDDLSLWCWGSTLSGELGLGEGTAWSTIPVGVVTF